METRVNDLLLLYHDSTPLGYARVEDINPDVKRGWWQLSMLLLKVPAQHITWILKEEYIDGAPFTMSGETMRLERVPKAGTPFIVEEPPEERASSQPRPDNVIELRPRGSKEPPPEGDIA